MAQLVADVGPVKGLVGRSGEAVTTVVPGAVKSLAGQAAFQATMATVNQGGRAALGQIAKGQVKSGGQALAQNVGKAFMKEGAQATVSWVPFGVGTVIGIGMDSISLAGQLSELKEYAEKSGHGFGPITILTTPELRSEVLEHLTEFGANALCNCISIVPGGFVIDFVVGTTVRSIFAAEDIVNPGLAQISMELQNELTNPEGVVKLSRVALAVQKQMETLPDTPENKAFKTHFTTLLHAEDPAMASALGRLALKMQEQGNVPGVLREAVESGAFRQDVESSINSFNPEEAAARKLGLIEHSLKQVEMPPPRILSTSEIPSDAPTILDKRELDTIRSGEEEIDSGGRMSRVATPLTKGLKRAAMGALVTAPAMVFPPVGIPLMAAAVLGGGVTGFLGETGFHLTGRGEEKALQKAAYLGAAQNGRVTAEQAEELAPRPSLIGNLFKGASVGTIAGSALVGIAVIAGAPVTLPIAAVAAAGSALAYGVYRAVQSFSPEPEAVEQVHRAAALAGARTRAQMTEKATAELTRNMEAEGAPTAAIESTKASVKPVEAANSMAGEEDTEALSQDKQGMSTAKKVGIGVVVAAAVGAIIYAAKTGKISEAWQKFQQTRVGAHVSDAANKLHDTAQDMASKANANPTVQKVKTKAQEVTTKATEIKDKVRATAAGVADDVRTTASAAAATPTGQKIGAAADKAHEAAERAAEAVRAKAAALAATEPGKKVVNAATVVKDKAMNSRLATDENLRHAVMSGAAAGTATTLAMGGKRESKQSQAGKASNNLEAAMQKGTAGAQINLDNPYDVGNLQAGNLPNTSPAPGMGTNKKGAAHT